MPVKVSFPSPSPHRVFDARDRDIERYPNRSWEHGYCIRSKSATEARVLGIDVQEVVAVPTAEVVGSYPTVQHIVATIAYERIVANPSSQHIVATAPGEDIRAGTTIQREGRSRGCTGEGVAPVPPDGNLDTCRGHIERNDGRAHHVHDIEPGIPIHTCVGRIHIQRVIARSTAQHIDAEAAIEDVVTPLAR